MKKRDQAVCLASTGAAKTVVTFCCNKCETEYSEETPFAYLAARKAITAGWRVDDEGCVHCSKCAEKQP